MTPKAPKIIEGFDAVAESRKWKEAVGRELLAMNEDERFVFLRAETEKLRSRLAAFHAKRGTALMH